MAAPADIIHVPHLGGIDVGHRLAARYDPRKPTCILINSFTTSCLLYEKEFQSQELTDAMNLLAIEPMGHGQTRAKVEHFTFWDTAVMNLQVMDALAIDKAFVMGTSQGGFLAVRMALLAPDRIQGIVPLGTSMDSESQQTRDLGSYDADESYMKFVDRWTTTAPTPDWVVDDDFCELIMYLGFGTDCPEATAKKWTAIQKGNYRGDDGRKRLRMALINVMIRDSLHLRLKDVRCPVLWIHGSDDVPFNIRVAEQGIKLFTNCDAKLLRIEGGGHYLNATHPKETDAALLEFVKKHQSR